MTNYFSPEPDGNQIYTAESGTIVKVRKEGSNFKIAKYPKPITGTISLTATPTAFGYAVSYEYPDSTRSRNDQQDTSLPSELATTNPPLQIYNTDILSIKVNLYGDGTPFPLSISTNDEYPLIGVTVGSLVNNGATSGEYVKWYPGAGVTGDFFYMYADADETLLGNTISVISAPQ